MVLEKKGNREINVKMVACFSHDTHFEGLFNNTENFCETARIHHVLL